MKCSSIKEERGDLVVQKLCRNDITDGEKITTKVPI